ncbi:MAG: cardiolipin synthase [Pirellulaceae bacterium]|nr:cardiolipin synthase [Planctomycetales bacterium]MCA9226923.1 cardiolipin synthase [Planctomycetales bacterium]
MSEWLPHVTAAVVSVFELLALLTAVHAVMQNRTAQGATAWVISLVTFPIVSLPLYWLFGRGKFQGYVNLRRAGDRELREIVRKLLQYAPQFVVKAGGARTEFDAVNRLISMPFTRANDARLLIDGEAAFGAMLDAIDRASDYVLLEFFIVHDDQLGRELAKRLRAAVARGVRVYFLYDEIGSHWISRRYLRDLTQAGVTIRAFNTIRGWRKWFQLNFRNHRKIVVADGRFAFVGGLNVGDEYMGRLRKFGNWRDTHLQIEGPAVQCVQMAFLEDWYWATGTVPEMNWEPVEATSGDMRVLPVATGPADDVETCGLFFVQMINAARKRIWITSPYFVPDLHVITALVLAALRGVEVRVMLPEKADHLLVYLSGFSFIEDVDEQGVDFYRYQDGFMHQKVMLIDDDAAVIGTANFDNRSFRLNFEISILVNDREFASSVERMLEADFEKCVRAEVDDFQRRPFWFRVAVRFARLMAPLQ